MVQTPATPHRNSSRNSPRLDPTPLRLFALAFALLVAPLVALTWPVGPAGQVRPAVADLHLSGTVGGRVLLDDPGTLSVTRDGDALTVVVTDPILPLRLEFAPGLPLADGLLFDLGTYPLRLALLVDGAKGGRTFTSREGELTVAEGTVHISARLVDTGDAVQFLSASIPLAAR